MGKVELAVLKYLQDSREITDNYFSPTQISKETSLVYNSVRLALYRLEGADMIEGKITSFNNTNRIYRYKK